MVLGNGPAGGLGGSPATEAPDASQGAPEVEVSSVNSSGSSLVRIGIEVKDWRDLVSSLHSGRLQAGLSDGLQDGQLAHLLRCYDVQILMVYGVWRACPDTGKLQNQWHGKWYDVTVEDPPKSVKYEYVSRFLMGPGFLLTGIRLVLLPSLAVCSKWIYDLDFEWSQPFDEHKSTKVFDKSGRLNGNRCLFDRVEPGTDRWRLKHRVQLAKELPNIGYEAANAMAKHFKSARAMFAASKEEIAEIRFGKGNRRIGKTRAEGIDDVLK